MGAYSVTGVGKGAAEKRTTTELAVLANAPAILLTGRDDAVELPVSPSGYGNTVIFPKPLPGLAADYVVMLTAVSANTASILQFHESGGNFIGFTYLLGEFEGSVMYMIAKIGVRPDV